MLILKLNWMFIVETENCLISISYKYIRNNHLILTTIDNNKHKYDIQ